MKIKPTVATTLIVSLAPSSDRANNSSKQPQQRGEHQHGNQRSQRPRPPMLRMQEIKNERIQRRHGPVTEIENARRLVRQHQTHTGQPVNRPGGEPYDNKRQKLVHRSLSLTS